MSKRTYCPVSLKKCEHVEPCEMFFCAKTATRPEKLKPIAKPKKETQ